MNSDPHCIVFNWNVRGLNQPARRQVVKDLIKDHQGTVVCLQETKLAVVDDGVICSTFGQQFLGNYAGIPAAGVRGGVIIACSQDHNELTQVDVRQYSVTDTIGSKVDNGTWSISGVYSPQGDNEKVQFLDEIRAVRQQTLDKWMILGDFNLIYRSCNKK